MKKLTAAKQQKALKIVAKWMGEWGMTEDGSPVPTGPEAAYKGLGPELRPDWDWPGDGKGTPTIILEGGPYDWALEVTELQDEFSKIGVFAEPYSGWALCLYPEDY